MSRPVAAGGPGGAPPLPAAPHPCAPRRPGIAGPPPPPPCARALVRSRPPRGAPALPWALGLSPGGAGEGKGGGLAGAGGFDSVPTVPLAAAALRFLFTSQPCFLASEVKPKYLGWPRPSAPGGSLCSLLVAPYSLWFMAHGFMVGSSALIPLGP